MASATLIGSYTKQWTSSHEDEYVSSSGDYVSAGEEFVSGDEYNSLTSEEYVSSSGNDECYFGGRDELRASSSKKEEKEDGVGRDLGLPPIPEYECYTGPLDLVEWSTLSRATYHELAIEWSMLCQECTDCWTRADLQLAAELGKTLLERNRELENSLKHQQAIIDDQAQEIEYLTKQTAALREVNDSRLRIYEQLEDAIADLEKTNNRLDDESKADKSKIKSLCSNVDILEARCEELQRGLDDARCQERQRKRRDRRRGSNKEENTSRKGSGIEPTSYQSLPSGETSDYSEEDSPSPPSPPHDFTSPEGHEEELVRVHHVEGGGGSSRGRESIHSSTSTDSFWQHSSTDEERSNSPQERQVLEEPSTLDVMTMMGGEEGDVARLNREVAWLSEETRLGDRRAQELEEQVQSLVSENACLKSRLECGYCDDNSSMQFQRQSTVEQEVLALEEVSEGLVCKRCLGVIDEPTSMTLVGEVLRRSAAPILNWATKRGYDRDIKKAVVCFLRRVGCSPAWLDTWLCLVTLCTLILSLLRALLGAPLGLL